MAVYPDGGHVVVERSGRKLWGTDEPPVSLIPDAWASIPVSIAFADFAKDVAYGFNIFTTGPFTTMYGLSIVKILPQETTFADQVIGTVPAGMNYVDWRVNLAWTAVPSPARGYPVASPVLQGKETDLRGGSGLIELSGCFRRSIHVGVVGTNIVLSRKQSTRNMNENPGWTPGNATHHPGGGPWIGWTYGVQQEGAFAYRIDGVSAFNNAWRGGSSGASLVDPTNYASTWTGSLLVKPGRYNSSI